MKYTITNKTVKSPYFLIIYGEPGAGKSTLASHSEECLFIATESGVEKINCAKMINDDGQLIIINNQADFFTICKEVLESEFKTIVIDSAKFLDRLFAIDQFAQFKIDGKIPTSLGDYGYGAGYARHQAYWHRFLKFVTVANTRNKNVILLSHSKQVTVSNPAGTEYKKATLSLPVFGQCDIPSDLCAQATHVAYLVDEPSLSTKKTGFGNTKSIAVSQEKIIYCKPNASFIAKARTTSLEDVKDFYIWDSIESIKEFYIDINK